MLYIRKVKKYVMPELFLIVCIVAVLAFIFSPYELTMEEDDI